MGRPHKKKKVCHRPLCTMFGPMRPTADDVLTISVEGFETLHLIDYQNLTQEEAAQSMGIARTSVQRLYQTTRHMIASALIEGKYIRISGGTHVYESSCQKRHQRKERLPMRIIIAMHEDNIAEHYGKATSFLLVTIERDEITRRDNIVPEDVQKGGCRKFMLSLGVNVIITKGMSKQAYKRYLESDIKVYHAQGHPHLALENFLNKKLDSIEGYLDDTDCHGEEKHEDNKCCQEKHEEKKCCQEEHPDDCCHD